VDRLATATAAIDTARAQPKTNGATRPERDARIGRKSLLALEIAEVLAREFPPKETLLSPWLRRQDLVMIHAKGGVGKTHFALGVAYAAASAGSFLRWRAERPRKVLYIDGEMPGAALKERLAAIVAANDVEPPENYFRILMADVQENGIPDIATLEGQEAIEPLIRDAEIIVLDNLSALARAGIENEGESWLPIATWALRMRREGRCVVFIHHSGKGGLQRGTSRREDFLDVVINLRHSSDYVPEHGARFDVVFEKARGLLGEDVQTVEAHLTNDGSGRQAWSWRESAKATFDRVLELHALDMSLSDIAAELDINKSTASRHLKRARDEGLIRGAK
jgi:DNA-binding transcriptional ArsR family regulator